VTYDGAPHGCSATAIVIGGATVSGTTAFTYNGNATAPTAAGTYAVSAIFASSDPNYGAATGTGSLTIGQATPSVTAVCPSAIFDGNSHACSALATGVGGTAVGGSFAITYNGIATAPTAAGTYAVNANFTSGDANYTSAAGAGALTIGQATPVITVICPANVFEDEHRHACTATATGVGGTGIAGSITVTYNGKVNAPSEEGTYRVVARFTSGDPNYANATGASLLIIRERRHHDDRDRDRDDHHDDDDRGGDGH
jgi:hypothetical protein